MADFQLPSLISAIQEISKTRFNYHSGLVNLKIEESPVKERGVVAFWMGLILISGKDVRVTFKTNFYQASIKKIISKKFNKPIEQITTDQTKDFVREFCNLVAGTTKTIFEQVGSKVGISLPLVLRGFDNLFFNEKMNESHATSTWRLSEGDFFVDCCCYIEVLSNNTFKDVDMKFVEREDNEVDFL